MEELFNQISEQQGWNPDTQVSILLNYISNQQSDESFKDFLEQQVNSEKEE